VTRRTLAVAFVTLLSSAACTVPNFEGAQIQEPPVGFLLQPESVHPRPMFPDLEMASHTTWVHTDVSGTSIIYVDGHPGVLDVNDVTGALERAIASSTDRDRSFTNIELLTVDGRRGWAWSERVESDLRGLVDVSYKAVIPYDTITYAIEFASSEPSWKAAAPDTLRAVISTFAIGRTTWNVPLLAIVLGGGLLGISVLRSRSQKRDQQLRSINLVSIKKEEDEEAPPTGAPAPPPPVSPTEMSSRPRPPTSDEGSA